MNACKNDILTWPWIELTCAYDMVSRFHYILTPLPPSLLGYTCDHCVELTSGSLREGDFNLVGGWGALLALQKLRELGEIQ